MHNFVVVVSNDVEVYKSLKRAFCVSNIVAREWEDYVRNKQISKSHPILIFTENRDSLYEWVWNDIRVLGAVLALEAKELLCGQSMTTSLEAVSLQHQLEVKAECSFLGVAHEIEVEPRFEDIESEVNMII